MKLLYTVVHCFCQKRFKHTLNRLKTMIDNRFLSTNKETLFPVLDPADESVIIEVPDMTASDAKKHIHIAAEAFKTWSEVTAKERSSILRSWYNVCVQNSDYIAEVITAESGKPLDESKGEVSYGNSFLDWYADSARHLNGEIISSPWPNKHILLTRQPLGVVSVITPWNFPFAMITRKVGALMAAGCTCVIKPSEETPLSALVAVELAEKAGVPQGVVNVVTASRKNAIEVGNAMCLDDDTHCISFTGSTTVGKILYKHASKKIKRVVLELGGNAPFIVFPSADLQNTLNQAMLAKFRNNGQACVAANRFLVHEDIHDKFVCGLKELIEEKCVLGPGSKKGVTCGPLINTQQAKIVSELVKDSVQNGACLVTGGEFDTNLGKNFYKSTILINVTPSMKIFKEEIFGPIVQVTKMKSEEEAIQLANTLRGGLAAYVFTKDLGESFRMAKRLDFGMVAINDGILSCPEAAFGGTKETGIGREGSLHGALDYTDIKYTLVAGLHKC